MKFFLLFILIIQGRSNSAIIYYFYPPYTITHNPYLITHNPSTITHNPSTITHNPSTKTHNPSTITHNPSTITHNPSIINRISYYKALEENNRELVNTQLTELKTASEKIQDAFMGAMLMKKGSFIAAASTKLHLFREGRKMLENAILRDPDNAEFRFLRLIIQEHAPGILGYKNDLQKDSDLIRKYYKSLPEDLQQIITDYSKKSKFLKLEVS